VKTVGLWGVIEISVSVHLAENQNAQYVKRVQKKLNFEGILTLFSPVIIKVD
jgi:hypothetical protein